MKSAEEILREHSSVCPKFPDPTCGGGCMCNADLAAIRAAQIDAAQWMWAAAQQAVRDGWEPGVRNSLRDIIDAIRSIKLPGDGA